MDSQACVSLVSICDSTSKSNQQLTLSFGDSGLYSSNLLNLSTQAQFPNYDNVYCFNHELLNNQLSSFKGSSGILSVGAFKVPIGSIQDVSAAKNVKNIQWFVVGTVVFVVIFVGIGVRKPWL
ncbi:Hypothetical_protein [Hexamita inflata]|uniref:Hypothetical_protein n=1 Tax=Hexamita inflata TaxID=28002 RepID=A0ABP1HET1_9EUKA